MKSAWIAIVGRPSVGKSTILNALCGRKISIVAASPQTTRNKVRGILSEERGQIVFVDTPGYHQSDKKFNRYLKELSISSLGETDLILYVADASRPPGEEERELASLLRGVEKKTILFINKTDLPGNKADPVEAGIRKTLPMVKSLRGSAENGDGIEALKNLLFMLSPEGEALYPEEYYTDQEPEFRVSEIIREKAISDAREEVPHSLYVEISDMEADEENNLLWIRAFIIVERESQKGIIVGKGGVKIKSIRTAAQKEIARVFGRKVTLDLRVKAHSKWRGKDPLLRRMIH